MFLVPAAHAWGPNGHRMVGRIAEQHLTAEATRGVAELIAPDTLAEVAPWADEIRSDPAWDSTHTWHWVSIDDGESYATTEKTPTGDVIEAIERLEATLRHAEAGREDKQVALKFLVHLVADLHQPLHVGRRADRGGNEVEVSWFDQPSDLHTVWDTGIIASQKLSFTEFVAFLDPPSPDEISTWQSTDYLAWADESYELRETVYDVGDGKLGYAYANAKLPVIKRRLLQAGVRLAGVLNSIFAAPPPNPQQD
ncbi:MAG: S1/P1 nuclease [bacterium]|nr:S1/P1 nuclease [bacterium]